MTKWIAFRTQRTKPSIRLFCLPYAGGGARLFRKWGGALPNEVEVCPIELPSRGTRLGEPPVSDLPSLVGPMAAGLEPLLDLPFAIFGYSMGALVGFELARVLRRRYHREPVALLVAAQNAPSVPLERSPAHLLSDEELSFTLHRSGGMSEEALGNARLMRVFLPVLRADYSVVDTYSYELERPLQCPVHLFAGMEDPLVSDRGLAGWRRETSGELMIHCFPGGHFFFRGAEGRFLAMVSDQLRGLA